MSTFSQRLKQLRTERGWSQQLLANYLKVSKSSINMYERGEREPGIELLESVADIFNVDLDYLIGRSDIPNKYQLENKVASPTLPKLTKKDQRDISRSLEATLAQLESAQDGLMFDGEPLDEETRELLEASLRNSMEFAKKLAKQKYTPKKYQKTDTPK